MQNQAAVEALYSATFVEDYLDYVENVPDDLQRHHSRLRELDMSQHQELLTELDNLVEQFEMEKDDPVAQRKLLIKMQLPLIASQDIGDDKIQIVQTLTDTIENKTRQLEHDSQNLDFGRQGEEEESPVKQTVKKESDKEKTGGGGGGKRRKNKDEPFKEEETSGSQTKSSTPNGKKVKKTSNNIKAAPVQEKPGPSGPPPASSAPGSKRGSKKAPDIKRERSASPPDLANVEIDPDEPTYCLCDQVSYGEMIGCDNDLCPIEWFHFNCVQLSGKPKGKWFCPKCRGDKPTVMKPKAQFLKELEKYNKEKEDKVK